MPSADAYGHGETPVPPYPHILLVAYDPPALARLQRAMIQLGALPRSR